MNEDNELIAIARAKQLQRNNSPKQKLSLDQIQDASDTVKANLINIMVSITQKLANDQSIGPHNLAQIAKLTETAQRLFAWPNTKPIDSAAPNSTLPVTTVINLPLIRTTPEQLRAKARLITPNAPNKENEQKKLAS